MNAIPTIFETEALEKRLIVNNDNAIYVLA